jgi:isocitrate lyase
MNLKSALDIFKCCIQFYILYLTTEYRWFKHDRWKYTKRNYKPSDVASLRGSIDLVTPSHYMSKKLYWTLRHNFEAGTCSKTYGALDVIQLTNMCKYLTSIYVSGW